MTSALKDTSKFLSYVLRHKPDAIGLTLDPEGWADIEELIAKSDIPITLDLLHEVYDHQTRYRNRPRQQRFRFAPGHRHSRHRP